MHFSTVVILLSYAVCRQVSILVLALLVGLWEPPVSAAYVRTTAAQTGTPAFWRTAEVPLNILVGCPDGACFETAARTADAAWTAAGAQFTFRVTTATPTARIACAGQSSHIDGRITLFWSADNRCALALGGETLAITHMWIAENGWIGDADIEFNNDDFRWGVYTGPIRTGVPDFQRIALHELGHVLGLDHPDDHGQTVPAIMNGRHSNFDRLQPDDIAGIRAIYGRTQTTAPTRGALENPGQQAVKTGIGVVRGWVCDATRVEVEINGSRIAAFYGQDRGDTRSVCGDANNGFLALVNWNLFGTGTHQVRLLADGQELVQRSVRIVTYGTAFLRGHAGQWKIADWPTAGTDTIIGWTEGLQNIEIVDIQQAQTQRPPPQDPALAATRRLLGHWRFTLLISTETALTGSGCCRDTWTLSEIQSGPLPGKTETIHVAVGQTATGYQAVGGEVRKVYPDVPNPPYPYFVLWQDDVRTPGIAEGMCHMHLFRLRSDTTAEGIYLTSLKRGGVCETGNWTDNTTGVRMRAMQGARHAHRPATGDALSEAVSALRDMLSDD